MYDLEILVPAEGKFRQRFKDFKKWGIRNIQNRKIRLILAASNDNEIEMFDGGWPAGIDVEVVITPYKQVAQRIYHYYDSIIKTDTAKWYYRIDEDSMNDIDGLMKNLELFFDHEREYHMTGDINWDVQELEKRLLTKLGFGYWYNIPENTPPHEYEVSITSNAAMKRILANEKAQNYFKLRKEIPEGYGDHGLCFCARMEKIHPIMVKFLTVRPEIHNFSEFNGHFNHIHWISKDTNPYIMNWLESISKENEKQFCNYSFIFFDANTEYKRLVLLNENNRIEEISIENNSKKSIGLWTANKDNKLTFYLEDTQPTEEELIIFDVIEELHEVKTFKHKNYILKTGPLSALLKI